MIHRYLPRFTGIVVLSLHFALGLAACGGGGGGGGPGPNPNLTCAQTCAGCCLNGTCQPGSGTNACGQNGVTCVSCGKFGQCVNGGCMLDLSRQATLRIAYVKFTSTNGTADWDGDGSPPDPYLTVMIAGRTVSTPYIQNPSGSTATFNRSLGAFTVAELTSEWTFSLYDDDLADDDWMGGCKGALDPDDLDRGYAQWSCGSTIQEIRFDIQ